MQSDSGTRFRYRDTKAGRAGQFPPAAGGETGVNRCSGAISGRFERFGTEFGSSTGMDILRPELKKQRQRRKVFFLSITTLAALGLVFLVMNLDPALPTVPRGSTWIDLVERGAFTREVRGPGSLVPRVIRWIPATSGGRVERILAKPGAGVEPDTVLVEMSNPELVQRL